MVEKLDIGYCQFCYCCSLIQFTESARNLGLSLPQCLDWWEVSTSKLWRPPKLFAQLTWVLVAGCSLQGARYIHGNYYTRQH